MIKKGGNKPPLFYLVKMHMKFAAIRDYFLNNAFWIFSKKVVREWKKDGVGTLGAALAFHIIISLPALILAVMGIMSIFLEQNSIRQSVLSTAQNLLGSNAREIVESILKNANSSKENALRAILGTSLLFLSITNVFGQIQTTLNAIYKINLKPKIGFFRLLLKRFLTFINFILVSLIFSGALLFNTWVGLLSKFWRNGTVMGAVATVGLNLIVSLTVFTILLAIVFRILPDGKIRLREVVVGSCITAILFLVGEALIGLYLKNVSISSSYGVTGSLVVVLLWVYYSAQIIFLGAEITYLYAVEHGQGVKPDSYAVKTV
jgi:membrane protein